MTIGKPRGGVPKPLDKRRIRSKPRSYGLAESEVAGMAGAQPELGFEPHQMVADMWEALGESAESQFFSEADWIRARWEMWNANELFTGNRSVTVPAWVAVQKGLSELLVSPADKRRAGIQLKRHVSDPDEDAAVLQIARYHDTLNDG